MLFSENYFNYYRVLWLHEMIIINNSITRMKWKTNKKKYTKNQNNNKKKAFQSNLKNEGISRRKDYNVYDNYNKLHLIIIFRDEKKM